MDKTKVTEAAFVDIEQNVIMRMTLPENSSMNGSLFQFIIQAWKKAQDATNKIHMFSNQNNKVLTILIDSRIGLITKLSTLLVSSCNLLFNSPETFIQPEMYISIMFYTNFIVRYVTRGAAHIADILLTNSTSIEDHLPIQFFTQFVNSLDEKSVKLV